MALNVTDGIASMALWLNVTGACYSGFDGNHTLLRSDGALSASNADECAKACLAHGDACASASWWRASQRPTAYHGVSSR